MFISWFDFLKALMHCAASGRSTGVTNSACMSPRLRIGGLEVLYMVGIKEYKIALTLSILYIMTTMHIFSTITDSTHPN